MKPSPHALAVMLLTLIGQAGCHHFGPRSVMEDRIPYNEAIASSWKEQTLLNIVKIRYMDTPFFIDVPQITGGYTLQGAVNAGGSISPPVSPLASFGQQLGAAVGFQGSYQDRPTICYAPQTGSQFIRNLTVPLNPGSVLFLLQSGYPADVGFPLTVESINGVKNRSVSGGQLRRKIRNSIGLSGRFARASPAMSGSVSSRIRIGLHCRSSKTGTSIRGWQRAADVRKVLQLDPDVADSGRLGATAAKPNEIPIL